MASADKTHSVRALFKFVVIPALLLILLCHIGGFFLGWFFSGTDFSSYIRLVFPNRRGKGSPRIDGELALQYAQGNYDLGPKVFRTEGAMKSAEWILSEANTIKGLEKAGGKVRHVTNMTGNPPPVVCNVEIAFPGPTDDFVVIGAHHDTKMLFDAPDFAGANDGASGVGALLAMAAETAYYAQKKPLPCGIRFVFFDGEEALYQYTETDGLVGSRAYVETLRREGSLKHCRAMILLDMIGDRDLDFEIAGNSTPALDALATEAVRDLGYEKKVNTRECRDMIDDHVPFLQAGIPALDLIDFNYGPNNAYWHTKEDTMDKISADSIKTAADVAFRVVWILAENGFKDLSK